MKHIKNKILLIVLSAIAAVAVLFIAASNIFFYTFFESEARKAIQNNININEGIYEDYYTNIFSSYLKYVNLSDLQYEDDYMLQNFREDVQGAEVLYNYFKEEGLKESTVYSMDTNESRYVFAVNSYETFDYVDPEWYTKDYDFDNNPPETIEVVETYIVYVDILPVMSFTRDLNWISLAILVIVSLVIGILGLNLGKRIESIQDNQNRFFQNASHELKTPLMSIQGYAEAIQEDIMEHHKAADIIMEESDRMSGLVEEILAISKIDSGQLKLNCVPVDIREILYDCVESQKIIFEKNNIDVELIFSEEKVMAPVDDVQLRRAFMNIISNDIRFCSSKLKIYCKKNAKYAVIKFVDDGPGMDQETQEKIFTRFYMGKKGKTGIGLALTKEIINLHNGKIKAHNGDRGGTVFEIQLPGID